MPVPVRIATVLCVLSVALAASTRIIAQQSPAGTAVVSMVVTVAPPEGKRPPVINREDVRVYQGKKRLEVTGWQQATGRAAGLGLFILIDETTNTSLGSQLSDIRDFINAQPSTTAIGMGYMVNSTVRIVQNFTTDHAAAAKALRLPMGTTSGMDSPYLSLLDLIKRWPHTNARREVVMISDGIDRFRLRGNLLGLPSISVDAQTAGDRAQRDRVIIHTIYARGIGHADRNFWLANMGVNNLSMVSDVTGGSSYFLGYSNPPSFKPWLDRLQTILQNQFWLSFRAIPGKKVGLQYVRLETEVPGAELVAANGVYVPAT